MNASTFELPHLKQLCNVLGDTSTGLTGSEIGVILVQIGIPDPGRDITKRDRLFSALELEQTRTNSGDGVLQFIRSAMMPVRFTREHGRFESLRTELNRILALCGFALLADGSLQPTQISVTLRDAVRRAETLRNELVNRGVHPDVRAFCQAEWLENNYFHAVFEATKSVADKIRQRTGLSLDGAELVDKAFGTTDPMLRINQFRSPTDRSEQRGFVNLVKGVFGMFRNTAAHEPKVYWPISEQDALDLMSLVSLIHRRLDSAVLSDHPDDDELTRHGAEC